MKKNYSLLFLLLSMFVFSGHGAAELAAELAQHGRPGLLLVRQPGPNRPGLLLAGQPGGRHGLQLKHHKPCARFSDYGRRANSLKTFFLI